MTDLEETIGYEFRDLSLLDRALTTPACRMDRPECADNQRLEFLGDAVFGFLAADALYAMYPDEQEGPLTVRRTHLVSGATLAEAAERIGLRHHLHRNKGASELPPRAKPLSDAMEALMGAVWLDGGLDPPGPCSRGWRSRWTSSSTNGRPIPRDTCWSRRRRSIRRASPYTW